MTDYANIAERAMRASLHVSVWRAKKFDRVVSDEVTTSKHADAGIARVNKHLFGTRRTARAVVPLFAAVLDAGDALRTVHERETLPWSNRAGERLLPMTNFIVYTEKMRLAGAAFTRAIDDFVEAYPRLYTSAQAKLGSLFDEDDFPAPSDIRRRYAYTIDFDPIPIGAGDFRVDLPADHLAQIEAELTARIERTTRDAMADAWRRLYEAVGRVAKASRTTADGKKGIVRDNLIANIREVVDGLGRLNVAADERLDDLRRQVERDLADIEPDALRDDDALRAATARKATDIMAAMAAFYTPATAAKTEAA